MTEHEVVPVSAGSVLVLDDEEMVREVVGSMLERLGFTAHYAADGAEAIQKYLAALSEGTPYTAVIIDLTIPGGMGGKETVARLLELDPGVKAIVSSGYSDDALMAEYREHGFCAVIPKPYTLKELEQALHTALDPSGWGGC
jgi:CheY-like chemotaxis protein